MACNGCKERSELLKRAREAYHCGDMPEVKRLLKEAFGTAVKDMDRLILAVVRQQTNPGDRHELFDNTTTQKF